MFKRKLIYSVTGAALLAVPMSTSLPTAGWAQLDEIIVTTRKREENLQNVPIAVEAFDADQIANLGIDNSQDVAKFSAGIQFDEGFGGQDTRIVIRGLSPTRGRPNAAFLIDGIDFTGEAVSTSGGGFLANNRLIDVERIEVVKGPQSALYGRSAFAGAVQYVTKSPNMDEFEAEAGFDIATDDQYEVTGTVSGPVSDNFGLLINGIYYDEGGFHENVVTGDEVGGADGWGISGTALWEATDELDFKLRLAYSEDEFEPRAQARVDNNFFQPLPPELLRSSGLVGAAGGASVYPGCFDANGNALPFNGTAAADGRVGSCFANPKFLFKGTVPDGDDLQVGLSPDPRTGEDYEGSDVEIFNATLVGTWDADFGTLTSLTGFGQVQSQQNFDSDWDFIAPGSYTSADGLFSFTRAPCGFDDCSPTAQEIDFKNETQVFSQELRYATNFDGPFNFTVGGLYWKEDVEQFENSTTGTIAVFRNISNVTGAVPAAQILLDTDTSNRFTSRDTEHWSIYGKAEWDINDTWKLTGEIRYVEEDIEVNGYACDPELTRAYVLAQTGTDLGVNACSSFTTPSSPQLIGGQYIQARTSSTVDLVGGGPALDQPDGIGDGIAKSSESFIAPKITLEYTPNDDLTFYASVAEGVKPGGVATTTSGAFFSNANNNFDAEKLRAYEIGAKTEFLDNTLRLNSSVFFQEYTDKQVGVTQFNAQAGSDIGTIVNAGEAEIWGVELEALWAVTDNFTLQGSYTWLDAEYTQFQQDTNSTTTIARNIAGGNGGCQSVVDPLPTNNTADAICTLSFNGSPIEDIPEHAFVGSAEYRAPLNNTDMDWFIGGTAFFVSERPIDETAIKYLDSYWTTDLRAGLSAETWDLLFYVENLFDDDTPKSAVDVGSQVVTTEEGYFPPGPTDGVIVSLPDPRIFGVRGRIRF